MKTHTNDFLRLISCAFSWSGNYGGFSRGRRVWGMGRKKRKEVFWFVEVIFNYLDSLFLRLTLIG